MPPKDPSKWVYHVHTPGGESRQLTQPVSPKVLLQQLNAFPSARGEVLSRALLDPSRGILHLAFAPRGFGLPAKVSQVFRGWTADGFDEGDPPQKYSPPISLLELVRRDLAKSPFLHGRGKQAHVAFPTTWETSVVSSPGASLKMPAGHARPVSHAHVVHWVDGSLPTHKHVAWMSQGPPPSDSSDGASTTEMSSGSDADDEEDDEEEGSTPTEGESDEHAEEGSGVSSGDDEGEEGEEDNSEDNEDGDGSSEEESSTAHSDVDSAVPVSVSKRPRPSSLSKAQPAVRRPRVE